jgi:preprotein translocase subunit Sss1
VATAGIIVGAIGFVVALAALTLSRKRTPTSVA